MMAWYGLVDPVSGDLVSIGTEAMFPNGDISAFTGVYDVLTFGGSAPDFAVHLWNPVTRALVPRPIPILISRLDDVEAWLLSDPDWLLAWNAMNATRRAQVRAGLRRVLAKVLGPQAFRQESQSVEI